MNSWFPISHLISLGIESSHREHEMGYLSLMLLAVGVVTAQEGKIAFKHKRLNMGFEQLIHRRGNNYNALDTFL